MKGHEQLELALTEVAHEIGYIAGHRSLLNAFTTFEIKTPDGDTILWLDPPYYRNKRVITYIKSATDFTQGWENLFEKRTVEKEISKWTKYVRNFPKRLKKSEIKNKLNSMNEDF